MSNWLFVLAQIQRRLWLTVSLYCASAVAVALVAAWLAPYVPIAFSLDLGADAVDDILSVLATSMLTVATFSLTALVTAYTSIANAIAPHAARLVTSDSGVRNPLGTFVGSFLYAMVGLLAVHTGYYGAQGRVILLFATIAVLVLVVIAMLRWIGRLSELAQMESVVARVVAATEQALDVASVVIGTEAPASPDGWTALDAGEVGFVQNIDMRRLERIAAQEDLGVRVAAAPGAFVHPGAPLLCVRGGTPSPKVCARLRRAFRIGAGRTFDQDPRHGCQVLGEIVSRALSPGVNDPGTAREVIYRTAAMLSGRDAPRPSPGEARVRAPRLDPGSLLAEAYGPVLRSSPGDLRLQMDIQRALQALSAASGPPMRLAARTYSRRALEDVLPSLDLEPDRQTMIRAALWSR